MNGGQINKRKSVMERSVMVITGASSGIGAAVARRMARDGTRLALAARREDRLLGLAAEVNQLGGEAIVLRTDVRRRDDLERMAASTLERWGRIDILFNNAGVAHDDRLEKIPPDSIRTEIDTNLTAVIECAQVVLPAMLRQKSGHIINTSSLSGLIATPGSSIYCATKYGVVGFSDALRRELLGSGVHVSAFCPGFTPSEITPQLKAHVEGQPNAPKFFSLMPTDYVADQVAGLIRRPRRILAIPASLRVLIIFGNLFPGIADVLSNRFLV